MRLPETKVWTVDPSLFDIKTLKELLVELQRKKVIVEDAIVTLEKVLKWLPSDDQSAPTEKEKP